jgi:HEAT repeat protein
MNPQLEEIRERLRSSDRSTQVDALLALRDLGAKAARDDVAAAATSPDAAVRATVASVLGSFGPGGSDTVAAALFDLLDDPVPIVRAEAADAAGLVRLEEAKQRLRRLLAADPDAVVRAAAAESLGDIGGTDVLGDLERALQDPDDTVRGFAAASLGLVGGESSAGVLERALLTEQSLRVRGELIAAAYRLGAAPLAATLALLEAADRDELEVLLNVVEELVDREPAVPRGSSDAHAVAEAMRLVAARYPALEPHARRIEAAVS